MIIETRYRDIPWSKASKCAIKRYRHPKYRGIWEKDLRGKPVKIIIPADPRLKTWFICEGPFYRLDHELVESDLGKTALCVCPHIAEIGD